MKKSIFLMLMLSAFAANADGLDPIGPPPPPPRPGPAPVCDPRPAPAGCYTVCDDACVCTQVCTAG